ncbi:MAG: FGGY-family carbohydrate kinase [Methylobacteriaceae bacterium]|jgi:glycerol kinase|nr:FGGY-family carbohydrate kinase [Methylobacteriaceae bacterium]
MSQKADGYVLAIDEGTTNAKAIAVTADGRVKAKASRPLTIETPHPGWVEQDGGLLWQATLSVIREVIAGMDGVTPLALAISNQRETAIGWDRSTGQPLAPAITWQCTRSAPFCEQLKKDGLEEIIRLTTGLPIAPLFSGSKMNWILANTGDGFTRAANGGICLSTIDGWLLWNLTGGHSFFCDLSNAARTQLLNLKTQAWDETMLSRFGIPAVALPQIRPSSGFFGETSGLDGVSDGIPILSMIGDSHAALFGHGCGKPGLIKTTYGTGSSVMGPIFHVDTIVPDVATTVAWHDGENAVYALEGNIAHTGDAVAWMLDATGQHAATNEELQTIPASVESTLGVYFVPALTGLGAPYWRPEARAAIVGMSRGTGRAHLVRAALESIAYQIRDVIEVMKAHPDFQLETLMVDGGPTRNDWLMQFQADLLQTPVARSDTAELSAIGAAALAWRSFSRLSLADVRHMLPQHEYFQPAPDKKEQMVENYAGWKKAVSGVIGG